MLRCPGLVWGVLALSVGATAVRAQDEEKVLTLYTHRHYEADKQLYSKFQELTGIEVKALELKVDDLLKRVEAEGEACPADVLVTVDAGRLVLGATKGVFQKTSSAALERDVPVELRDPEGRWFALTMRARVIACSRERVAEGAVKTYADLAKPEWKGKLLARKSDSLYNQSLVAGMIAHDGPEAALAWVQGMVANFARDPKGNDRDQVKAIAAGEGDLALVNTYYLGMMLASDNEAEREAAKAVRLVFPDQEGRGTHVNVSGAGVALHAKHPKNAVAFIEFLVGAEAQKHIAQAIHEYPVRAGVERSALLAGWGDFKRDALPVQKLGELNAKAVEILAAAGWK